MPKRENSLDKIEQEEYKSINEYAYMLYKGEGIEKDVKEAYKLFGKAAEMGDNYAMFWLGAICENEEECLSPDEGFEWFLKAAKNGYAPAQFQIGYHYLHGVYVEQNYYQAYKWFMLSAIQGYPHSQNSVGTMYLRGQVKFEEWYTQNSNTIDGMHNEYDSEKNQRMGHRWLLKSARQRHPSGLYNLAGMYLHGVYVDKDEQLAISLYRIANDIGGAGTRALDMLNKLGTDIRAQEDDYARFENIFVDMDDSDMDEEPPVEMFNYILGTQKLSFPEMTEDDELQIINIANDAYKREQPKEQ